MRYLIAAVALGASVMPALAGDDDLVMARSPHDVATTMDRLEAAVTGAGATVVARVDHAAAAQGADMELAPNEVQTWLAYQDPEEMLAELDGISEDASYVEAMAGALRNLTTQAAAE